MDKYGHGFHAWGRKLVGSITIHIVGRDQKDYGKRPASTTRRTQTTTVAIMKSVLLGICLLGAVAYCLPAAQGSEAAGPQQATVVLTTRAGQAVRKVVDITTRDGEPVASKWCKLTSSSPSDPNWTLTS